MKLKYIVHLYKRYQSFYDQKDVKSLLECQSRLTQGLSLSYDDDRAYMLKTVNDFLNDLKNEMQ